MCAGGGGGRGMRVFKCSREKETRVLLSGRGGVEKSDRVEGFWDGEGERTEMAAWSGARVRGTRKDEGGGREGDESATASILRAATKRKARETPPISVSLHMTHVGETKERGHRYVGCGPWVPRVTHVCMSIGDFCARVWPLAASSPLSVCVGGCVSPSAFGSPVCQVALQTQNKEQPGRPSAREAE